MATKNKIIEMSVNEYLEEYNSNHGVSINRHKVYKMIKDGELTAHKNEKGAWVIEIEVTDKKKEYTVKQFVEEYNKKHLDCIITEKKVRELATKGLIDARKVFGRWIITASPSRKLKLDK